MKQACNVSTGSVTDTSVVNNDLDGIDSFLSEIFSVPRIQPALAAQVGNKTCSVKCFSHNADMRLIMALATLKLDSLNPFVCF